MAKAAKATKAKPAKSSGDGPYRKALYGLQVELVKLQRDIIAHDRRLLVIFEGRDAAGKDGVIKRIVQHLSPRETRVVALGKPSDRESSQWYFQRFTEHLPAAQELVLFNRSWYNRAGVERVMGFCTGEEYERFMASVRSTKTCCGDRAPIRRDIISPSRSPSRKRALPPARRIR